MDLNSSNYKKIIIISIVLLFLIVIVYNIFMYGGQGIFRVMSKIISMSLWVLILGIVGFVIWLAFFWQKKIDVNYEVYRNKLDESKVNSLINVKNLYSTGDKTHPRIKYGKIIGYSPIHSFKLFNDNKVEYREEMSLFLVKKSLFQKLMVICPKSLHDKLHGDIYMKCKGLNKHLYYYYPDTVALDFSTVDETLFAEGFRWIQLDHIKNGATLTNKAMGLTKEDIDELKSKTGYEVAKDTTKGK